MPATLPQPLRLLLVVCSVRTGSGPGRVVKRTCPGFLLQGIPVPSYEAGFVKRDMSECDSVIQAPAPAPPRVRREIGTRSMPPVAGLRATISPS